MSHIITIAASKLEGTSQGWCAVVRGKGKPKVLTGGHQDTSRLEMAMEAAIAGLQALPDGASCVLVTSLHSLGLLLRSSERLDKAATFGLPAKKHRSRIDAAVCRALRFELDLRKVEIHLVDDDELFPDLKLARKHAPKAAPATERRWVV